MRPILGTIALALSLLAAGCGWVGDGDGSPHEWLETVCGVDATIAEPPADRSYDDYDAEATLTCSTPGRSPDSYYYVDAVAFRTDTDPEDELLAAVDGWESGDGMELRYATKEIGSGWAVVMSVAPSREIKDGLDRLEGFDVNGSAEVFGRSYE